MKFFSRFVVLAALGGAASSSSAYAKETSASIIVSDSHISALQATENPPGPGVRRQLRKLLATAQKAKSESALRLDAKEKAYKERSGVRHLLTTSAPTKSPKADKYATAPPTSSPTPKPSAKPSASPSLRPSASPSAKPSDRPSIAPTPESTVPPPEPTPSPTSKPSDKPSASPSLKPSGSPSAKPSDKPSLAPSGAPSEAPIPSPKTASPTTPAQGGFTGGTVDQCAATAPDYCVCGDCNEDTCGDSNTSNRPLAICLKPAPENSCGDTDTLTVSASPDKDCEGVFDVTRNAEPGLCEDGWYVTKDLTNCKQKFVNNYSVKTSCVNNNLAVDIHTSCSCELALCMKFNGYVFTGYNVPSQGGGKTWIVSGDDCDDLQDTTPGPVGCSVDAPSPTPPSPSPPCTAPGTQCSSGNCSDCCDGSVNCKSKGKYCGSDTSCSSLFGRA